LLKIFKTPLGMANESETFLSHDIKIGIFFNTPLGMANENENMF
jgi:hypothetical protein